VHDFWEEMARVTSKANFTDLQNDGDRILAIFVNPYKVYLIGA